MVNASVLAVRPQTHEAPVRDAALHHLRRSPVSTDRARALRTVQGRVLEGHVMLILGLGVVVAFAIGTYVGHCFAISDAEDEILFWAIKLIEARNRNDPWKVTNSIDCELEAAVDRWNGGIRAGVGWPRRRTPASTVPYTQILQVIHDLTVANRNNPPEHLRTFAMVTIDTLNWVIGRPSVCGANFAKLREIVQKREQA